MKEIKVTSIDNNFVDLKELIHCIFISDIENYVHKQMWLNQYTEAEYDTIYRYKVQELCQQLIAEGYIIQL